MREFVIEPALDAIQDAHQTSDRFARRQTAAYADAAIHAMYQTADADYFARWRMPPGKARNHVEQHDRAYLRIQTNEDPAALSALKEDIRETYIDTCCVASLFQSWCVFGILGFSRPEAARGVLGEPCRAMRDDDWGTFKWHLYNRVHAMRDAFVRTRLTRDQLIDK